VSDDKIRQALEALKRGERPECPGCGKPIESVWIDYAIWQCHTSMPFNHTKLIRSNSCYEREIETMRNAALALLNVIYPHEVFIGCDRCADDPPTCACDPGVRLVRRVRNSLGVCDEEKRNES
jgi:hypothetical protein